MKNIRLIILLLLPVMLMGQESEPPALPEAELFQLTKLPELTLPRHYRNRELPVSVDNSTQPYFRPIFNQAGYSCGQASGIAYNFTYEINRERNLPANQPSNQYPTHFTWNWYNSGYGYYGVSYLHSFQVVKHCGTPNVTDYGGSLSYGGPERWMSGYDAYYNGMHNRINRAMQIQAGTPEGLLTLKHWLNDHLDSSATGGVASFYAQYMSPQVTLPAGTPEAGKWAITHFGGNPNHAMTIVGYHDSIRYDYNGDGQYTNDLDINNDGVIDMRDWEIGGAKIAQSYGGAPSWGDEGFCYIMYKTLADELGNGGIWNHAVHVLDVKPAYDPQLTMKVVMNHDCRNTLKVTAGVSRDLSSAQPETMLEFPILKYQGACMYMQGGTTEPENKTIEFGLDLSPLLSYVNSQDTVLFFLQLLEDDPGGQGSGEIISCSVIDYTGVMQETPCNQTNLPIVNNGTTTLQVQTGLDFDKTTVVTSSLPPAPAGQYFSHQLIAANGAPPYSWNLVKKYDEENSPSSFPVISQEKLTPGNNASGFAIKELDFDFPFYDSSYSRVAVHVDGYLMFDEQLFPYPYFNDDMVLFTTTRNISPFMSSGLFIDASQNGGIWYEGNALSASFRWKCHLEDDPSQQANAAVTLYPSGKIVFHYGTLTIQDHIPWIPGISDGNDRDYQLTGHYNGELPDPDSRTVLYPYDHPEEITLSKDGLLSGTPQQPYGLLDLTVRATDNHFIYDEKTLPFSSSGIILRDSISAGGDEMVDYGDTVKISIEVTNIEDDTVHDASTSLTSAHPHILLTDSTEYLGTLPAGTALTFADAFEYIVSPDIPDMELIELQTTISGNRETWHSDLIHRAHAPVPYISDHIIDDINGRLDPGDTSVLILELHNSGSSPASDMQIELTCHDPWLQILQPYDTLANFLQDSLYMPDFLLAVSEDAPVGHVLELRLDYAANKGYTFTDSISLSVGLTLEDFETGDFSAFAWGEGGRQPWFIGNNFPYEGQYCSRSGHISHGQGSSLFLDIMVYQSGEIRFYKKVSCEDDENNDHYDYLSFRIDGEEQGRWDGDLDWSESVYPIETGYHRLEWKYQKDNTVSRLFDAAWIDLISLPSCSDILNQLSYDTDAIEKTMLPDDTGTDTLIMTNPDPGPVDYDILISYHPNTTSHAGRSILGSYLTCDVEATYLNLEQSITFTVYNASDDNEWIRDIEISVPEGMNLLSATDFTGGSGGDLEYDGTAGYGATAHWHGEDPSGWGLIKGGETATAEMTVFIGEVPSENIELPYLVRGDIYGNNPHEISGELSVRNLGYNYGWLALDTIQGSIAGNHSVIRQIYFNTQGLPDDTYPAFLIIREQFMRETVIPVTLTVDQFMHRNLDPGRAGRLSAFPNPFTRQTVVSWSQEHEEKTSLHIISLSGKSVRQLFPRRQTTPGYHRVVWDGKNDEGHSVDPGVYFFVLKTGETLQTQKVIKISP